MKKSRPPGGITFESRHTEAPITPRMGASVCALRVVLGALATSNGEQGSDTRDLVIRKARQCVRYVARLGGGGRCHCGPTPLSLCGVDLRGTIFALSP